MLQNYGLLHKNNMMGLVINMDTNLSIMFSGGLDSLIAWFYAVKNGYKPQAINVNLGQPYADKEIQSIKKLQSKFDIPVDFINMKELFPLIEKRLSNQIIPSRNVMLATIGSMFNPIVWINALESEVNGKEHDKSYKFFNNLSEFLSFTNNYFQDNTTITSPFLHMTKADTIKWALNNGLTKEDLFDTSTCYDGEYLKCGKCLSCIKRFMAFGLNGIIEPNYEINPLESDYFKELLTEIPKAIQNNDYSRFTRKRCEEFNDFLNMKY